MMERERGDMQRRVNGNDDRDSLRAGQTDEIGAGAQARMASGANGDDERCYFVSRRFLVSDSAMLGNALSSAFQLMLQHVRSV